MITYPEWSHLEAVEDKANPFATLYVYKDGTRFYIEPTFYTSYEGYKQRVPDKCHLIIKEMETIVKKNKLVVFVGDEDFHSTHLNGAIYLTVIDIADRLRIFVEDKSRGSDYGD